MLQTQWSTRYSDNLEYRPMLGGCICVCRRTVEKMYSRVGSWLDLHTASGRKTRRTNTIGVPNVVPIAVNAQLTCINGSMESALASLRIDGHQFLDVPMNFTRIILNTLLALCPARVRVSPSVVRSFFSFHLRDTLFRVAHPQMRMPRHSP
ncbi:hypothetical protein NEOLEDRAFT_1127104 [Neolentinus lepideus HHB14362 ss-1]|uniref:Uncharacterized protein n=1 Tax=Neolentinus lepideus HHB14362 ss-1 TaxID=1314782 RepID=A0A165VU76_9AGAM|nr:hypothetical protein NEOLEDRAFT_1127104 [Neolentinus lepideus HHB14362 ss-1]